LIVAEISLAGMIRVQARQFSKNYQVIINTLIASLVPVPLQVANRQSSKGNYSKMTRADPLTLSPRISRSWHL